MAGINKKAVFFSIVSLLIVIMFVATSELRSKSTAGETEIDVTRVRVKILNSMIGDMENIYFEKMVYMSAKNSLVGLSHFYADHGFGSSYIKSLDFALQDVMDDGFLVKGDDSYNLTKMGYIDGNYTLNKLISNISDLFERVNVEVKELKVSLAPLNSINQTDPWTIRITAEIKYDLRDRTNLASWKGETIKEVNIPVYGMYGYDLEGGTKSNIGVITREWRRDNATSTEPSMVKKMGYGFLTPGKGICLEYCEET